MEHKNTEYTTSADGTQIAFSRQGRGEPVLMVHGGGPGGAEDWALVAPHLTPHYMVVTMDRRGRGGSEAGRDYTYELEAADIAAVARAVGRPVHLVGHSSGAVVCLHAAMKIPDLRSLALYEPPLSPEYLPEENFQRITAMVREGDEAGAAELFMISVAATPEEMAFLKQAPDWQRGVASMRTLPQEVRAIRTERIEMEAVKRITVPVLLLIGENSTSPIYMERIDELERALPDVRRAIIPEQRHLAIIFAPEALAEHIESFLASVEQRILHR